MPFLPTHTWTKGLHDPWVDEQLYNGLDTMITLEVLQALQSLRNTPPEVYNFSIALQGPVLDMMCRGLLVDEFERQRMIADLTNRLTHLNNLLQKYAYAVWDSPLNARSSVQLQSFFYDVMKLQPVWSFKKGEKKLSMDREALEKLHVYHHAKPIINVILAIRDLAKQREVLVTEVEPDGRMRTSYNIAGTETARFSSSSNAFGTGTNLQNISRDLRHIFIADKGRKICGIDLEQAESREVAWLCWVLFGDPSYMDACLSGDLHTTVSRLGWPNLPWTGDIKKDRAIAEGPFYRWYTYRDMAKKLGHGCLTADHEVLTPNGWVSISACPEVILTWDLGSNGNPVSYFSSVSHWNAFPYSGTLHEFDGNSVSALMTSDHRVPCVADVRRPILRAKLAKDGPGHAMPLGGGWLGGDQIVPARLIAAFMSDGYQKGSSMEFHFHKERKKKRLRELCAKYGYELKESPEKMYVRGVLPKTPGPFMLLWTAECLRDFLDEYKHWDGHIGATSVSLHSSKLEHLRWLQTFGRILGIGGNINGPQISGFGTEMWSLQQNNRQWASGKSIVHSKQKVSNVPVFCPTVPSSWFYVRRNGKVFVTGNSNYYGKPPTMARHAKIPTEAAEQFQLNYFGAFPGIPKYHTYTAGQLQTVMKLTTPFGRTRHFFGRSNDDTTLREAIAYIPQSSTADRLNLALWRIWYRMGNRIRLLAQVHDALYFDFDENDDEADIVSTALSLIDTPMHHNGRTLSVPGEAKTGWNWGDFNDDAKRGRLNPGGLKKFKGEDKRTRPTLLERIL